MPATTKSFLLSSANPLTRLKFRFFSKVSLRNARRRLQGYGYKVSKKKIAIK
jgi:uncharacterized protein (TIGR04141 family)